MKKMMFVFIVIVWLMLWPLAAIWAMNTLFGLGIAYTFWNWLAVVVFAAFFGRSSITVRK